MRVLFVDDDDAPERATTTRLLESEGVEARFMHPEEVIDDDLDDADVVIVDYFLTHWDERDAVESASRAPRDGLAVIASLRSRLIPGLSERVLRPGPPRAIAFALWSANLEEATLELPRYTLPNVFAREHNLEWVFRRSEVSERVGAQRIASLARAVVALGGGRFDDDWIFRALGVSDVEWGSTAIRDVLDCHPPLFELAPRTGGLAVLRWLLHRVLPYPCFLLDERQLRARLRVDDLSSAAPLFEALSAYEYSGLLSDFSGRRWWRSGIEDWLFQRTDGNPGDSIAVAAIASSLGARAGVQLLRPVVVLSGELEPEDELVEADLTVRIRPDDWPPFADDAFARIDDARRIPELARIVEPTDRYLLEIEP
jgi:CheY-like chemotaxis protein